MSEVALSPPKTRSVQREAPRQGERGEPRWGSWWVRGREGGFEHGRVQTRTMARVCRGRLFLQQLVSFEKESSGRFGGKVPLSAGLVAMDAVRKIKQQLLLGLVGCR